jgi:hypothetical protein
MWCDAFPNNREGPGPGYLIYEYKKETGTKACGKERKKNTTQMTEKMDNYYLIDAGTNKEAASRQPSRRRVSRTLMRHSQWKAPSNVFRWRHTFRGENGLTGGEEGGREGNIYKLTLLLYYYIYFLINNSILLPGSLDRKLTRSSA